MSDALEIRNAWGEGHFVRCNPVQLGRLPLLTRDREILGEVGLPVGPEAALALSMRFENVQVIHSPKDVMALSDARFKKPPSYPLTGDAAVDVWARLDRFVVLGTVPNDVEPASSWFRTRFICLDGATGRVTWVSPEPTRGSTFCYLLNSSLLAYLASLLAYKQFRAHWPRLDELRRSANDSSTDTQYSEMANRVHGEFLSALEVADPEGFKLFWEEHAWNEAILLEI